MDSAYGNDKNPLIEKSEFILSLFEQLVGAGNLSAKEKSILDRCTADVYRDYMRSGYQGEVPTLKDLYRQLMYSRRKKQEDLPCRKNTFYGFFVFLINFLYPCSVADVFYFFNRTFPYMTGYGFGMVFTFCTLITIWAIVANVFITFVFSVSFTIRSCIL